MKITDLATLIKIENKRIILPKNGDSNPTIVHTKKYILISYKTDKNNDYYHAFRK